MKKDNKNQFENIINFDEEKHSNHNKIIEKAYKENYMYFYRVAMGILQNEEDAKDVVNDAFVKTYRYKEKFSENCPKTVPLIVNIVKSVAFNLKKRQSKIIFLEYIDEILKTDEYSSAEDYVLNEIILKEDVEILLSILSKSERDILELKVIDGLTFKEISEKTGISAETIRKRYQRMIKKLREVDERGDK